MKYGIAISNTHFDTLYVFVVPKNEVEQTKKGLWALPKGARISLNALDCDYDDTIFFFGMVSRDFARHPSFVNAQDMTLNQNAVQAEILWCTL